MAEFTVNPERVDPYKNHKFRVKWDGEYIAGVSKISPLTRTTEVVTYRSGGDLSAVRKSPGKTDYAPVILERGVTHDLAFEAWANKAARRKALPGVEMSLRDFRKDIVIELYNEAGQLAIAYRVYRCWVSEYQAFSQLDAGSGGVAFEMLKLENEGWDRDPDILEPEEPAY